MALVVTDDKYYKDIAGRIREMLQTDETFKPSQLLSKINDAFLQEALYNYEMGIATGVDDGRQAEHDAFWDDFQLNGNRTNYEQAFRGVGWTENNLKPKYALQPTNAVQMFYWLGWENENAKAVDLRASAIGVEIDFSKATSMNYCFQNARISHIGVVDLTSCKNVNTTFCNTYWLNSIEKIIVNENNVFSDNCFQSCAATEIRFEGIIASNIKLSYSSLSRATIESVMNHLSTATTGKVFTLKEAAVTKTFGSTESEEWLNLLSTKPNWTITLV